MSTPWPPLAAWHVFSLGVTAGLTFLTMTAFWAVSPRWLRNLLLLTGLLTLSRYVAMVICAISDDPQPWWLLRRCWWATTIGLTLPTVVAVDQLVRHPAMTPKKLLSRFSPFLIVYLLVMLLGASTPVRDPWIGWVPRLAPAWRLILSITQGLFVLGLLGVSGFLVRKLPSRSVRAALIGLMLAHASLGIDRFVRLFGGWPACPFLFGELLTLLAIWAALRTAQIQTM